MLNFLFSVFEFFGGMVTGSVAIISDAVHDFGDAASIGISYFLEKKSKRQPDGRYTYGYARYSVMGGFITTLILLVGSVIVIYNAIGRMITPRQINYDGMIVLAIVGVFVNFFAAFFTREGDSLNQKAVNLHMLEDVLGWAVVLAGAIVMRFTDFSLIDPVMSIGVSLFILINAIKNLKEAAEVFLEKTPGNMDAEELKEHIEKIDGVMDVHHIHVWSLDVGKHLATMHIVTDREPYPVKEAVREELRGHGIGHVTVEIETTAEHCREKHCHIAISTESSHAHHHRHGHHSHKD
jgi:cobalt-zinc-cadmium efflux system protein